MLVDLISAIGCLLVLILTPIFTSKMWKRIMRPTLPTYEEYEEYEDNVIPFKKLD